jgi:hypothetical protein
MTGPIRSIASARRCGGSGEPDTISARRLLRSTRSVRSADRIAFTRDTGRMAELIRYFAIPCGSSVLRSPVGMTEVPPLSRFNTTWSKITGLASVPAHR